MTIAPEEMSIAQQVALLGDKEREDALAGTDLNELQYSWPFWRRPSQTFPDRHTLSWWIGLMMAGRGCISPDTRIYLPDSDDHVPVHVLAARGEPVRVLTVDGPCATDGPPFLKAPPTPMYEVCLENGSAVTVTTAHRFLTPQGWQRLADAHVGQLLAVGPRAPLPSGSHFLAASQPDARHSRRTGADSRCGCRTCRHCDGPRLLPASSSVRGGSPSPVGADGHSQLSSDADVADSSPGCSRACPPSVPHARKRSSLGVPAEGDGPLRQRSASVELSLRALPVAQPDHGRSVFRLPGRADAPRRAAVSWPTRSVDAIAESDQPGSRALAHPSALVPGGLPVAARRGAEQSLPATAVRGTDQSPRRDATPALAGKTSAWCPAPAHAGDVVPWIPTNLDVLRSDAPTSSPGTSPAGSHQHLSEWSRIVSIHPVGSLPVYDLTVPDSANYLAEGMFHHNSGKTRTGTEFAHEKAMSMPGSRGLLVARTAADTRDVIIEGDSGLLQVGRPQDRGHYESSKRRITWPNGSQATLFTAEEPEVLRGPQGHWALCDEIATWRQAPDAAGLTAWDHVRIATRLPWGYGKDRQRPQIMALTTPKRTPIMKKLLQLVEENPAVVLRRDTTAANAGNLDPEYLSMIYGLFGGTRLSRQELDGMMLEDVEGALWTQLMLDVDRVEHLPYVPLVYVIAVDPSVAEEPTDECGILVCASTTETDLYRRQFYVVEDASVLGSPNVWASQVVLKAREYGCPIVAEVNQGGALVRGALQNIDPTIKVLDVRARYGKLTRAEPVSLAFEQHRGHMHGWWPDLESQLTSWTPADRKSPDRLDAMVWGATALLIKPPPGLYLAPIRAHSAARLRIPPKPTPSAIPSRVIGGRQLDRFGRQRTRQPGWRMVRSR